MKKKPKISIISVCYNSLEKIDITIKSILNQSYKEFEYIIVDGASSDYWSESSTFSMASAYNKEKTIKLIIRKVCREVLILGKK